MTKITNRIVAALQTKTERVQVRIDPEAKRRLERAATLANMTVSAFVVNNALEAADDLIRERERIILNDQDWEIFSEALLNPPEPNAALSKAFASHDRLIVKTTGG